MLWHIRPLWNVGAALALLCVVSVSPTAPPAGDPVEELRNVLRAPVRDSTNKEELNYRRDALARRTDPKVLGLGDLRRALLLQEWRDEDRDEAIAAIDRPVREKIANRLVEDLRRVLEKGGTPAKLAAITQIAEMGTNIRATGSRSGLARELAPDLIKQMKEAVPVVREAAARALGKVSPDPKTAAPALGDLMTTGSAGERVAAADGLAWLLRTVVELNKGRSPQKVEISGQEIIDMGAAVIPQAVRGLPDPDVAVRRFCLEAIQLAGFLLGERVPDPPAPSSFPPPGRKPTEDEAREIAAFRKALDEERRQTEPLTKALNDAVPAVGKVLADPVPEIRYLAEKALEDAAFTRQRMIRRAAALPPDAGPGEEEARRKGAPGVLTALPKVVAQKDPGKKGDAVADPLRPGLDDVLPLLAARLTGDPNVRVRLAAADAIEWYGTLARSAVPAVTRALGDPDLFVRWASARVLMKVGPYDTDLTVPPLARLLCDPDLDVRLAAEATLGSFGAAAKAAVPDLAKAALSGDAEQRIGAIHALRGVGAAVSAEAVPSLAAALADRDVRVRRAAAEALGPYGAAGTSAVPALERALYDRDDLVRKAASDSLLSITAAK